MQQDRVPLWLVKDRWQRDIVLYEDTWFDHILFGHAELRRHEAAVAKVLEKPHRVMYDAIESVAEPVLRRIDPKPVAWETVDPAKVVIRYDRPSDTLLIHLFGRGRSAISVHADRALYVMVDPDTEHIIGIHMEGFLAQAVKDNPWQIDILNYAELRGMTLGEALALQRELLGIGGQLAASRRAALSSHDSSGRWQAVSLFLSPDWGRWGLPAIPAS